MAKLFDIAVVTGTYQAGGETKKRYQNIGAVMEGQDGGQFIMLNAWFNPAGVPRKDGSESVLLSCFVPKDKTDAPQQRSAPAPAAKFEEDDIAF